MSPSLVSIAELNALDREAFVAALQPLFESAPPLAQALFDLRPFVSYAALLDATAAAIESLTPAEQTAVIDAHPRIGASATEVAARSAISYAEQGYDREAALDRAELALVYAELARLNDDYAARHGFGFVVFVDGRSKAEVLAVLRQRIGNATDDERRAALDAMLAIARSRLAKWNNKEHHVLPDVCA